jgi:ribonuclease P protein subunit RPR2
MAKRHRFERLKRERQAVAGERIDLLMGMAGSRASAKDFRRASRYAGLARGIGMRYNVRLSRQAKMQACKGCGAYLRPGINLRVRLGRRTLTRTCLECGRVWRMPLGRGR